MTSASTSFSEPNPQLLWDTLNGYQRTAALRAAIELDLFTAVGEGATTVEELSKRCNAAARGTRILCDFLAVIGFLSKHSGAYSLSPTAAAFLDRRSPAYMASMVQFINSAKLM